IRDFHVTGVQTCALPIYVEKIAEGSYGEVYQLHLREDAIPKGSISKSRLAKLRAYGDGVFKVVPIRAQSGVGSKKFTTVGEIVRSEEHTSELQSREKLVC